MSPAQATAEVFWTAFKSLPRETREDFLSRLTTDPRVRRDLLDLALIEKRRSEKTRPFSEYLAQRIAGQ